MCGRYYIDIEEKELNQIIKVVSQRISGGDIKTGEIYPTNIAPILRMDSGGTEPAAIKWGFPRWNGGGSVINARAETALDKSMFRKSLLERRCVIPSSGFYEWNRVDGKKQKDKYLLKRPGANLVYMAGCWNTFKSPDGEYQAFVIFTTASNDSMVPPGTEMTLFPDEHRPIHDRMPVILEPGECEDWLDSDVFAQLVLQRPGPELALTLVQP